MKKKEKKIKECPMCGIETYGFAHCCQGKPKKGKIERMDFDKSLRKEFRKMPKGFHPSFNFPDYAQSKINEIIDYLNEKN